MNRDELFTFVEESFDAKPDYPWSKWPNYAVIRHQQNKKWFAVVLDVQAKKLGLPDEGIVEIVNVKVDPDDGVVLRLAEEIMPAYHMNKKHWISLRLDGNIPRPLIEELVAKSYELTK